VLGGLISAIGASLYRPDCIGVCNNLSFILFYLTVKCVRHDLEKKLQYVVFISVAKIAICGEPHLSKSQVINYHIVRSSCSF
jgi:hypothetical protein